MHWDAARELALSGGIFMIRDSPRNLCVPGVFTVADKARNRIALTDLEPIMGSKLQYGGAGTRDFVRQQEHQIRRRTCAAIAGVDKPRRTPNRAAIFSRSRIFDLNLQGLVRLSLRSGIRSHAPDVPASGDVPALDQRAAPDETSRRLCRMNID
jgi:hypothetical protein